MNDTSQLDGLAKDIYQDAKFLRLIGCLLFAVASTAGVLLGRYDSFTWHGTTAFLACLACVGIVSCIIGDRLIRKIKKHTGVDVPHI